ncbi:hypothetical protein KP509_16G039900 [Ceratopteris richardii]|uniref:Uncharacterized protein n=1 Tax=Ceratopteris richardii TaxID=49495 RepID=A0A8T2SZM3_CERRI|nr:hypothetical protein KP509_16G039900 [Ceratopteris richardii]
MLEDISAFCFQSRDLQEMLARAFMYEILEISLHFFFFHSRDLQEM